MPTPSFPQPPHPTVCYSHSHVYRHVLIQHTVLSEHHLQHLMYRVGQNTLPTFSRALWREGGRRRVGLGSKGAGSWEVLVTTLRSRKHGVVQRAARICRRNLLFAKSLYRSGAACVPYSLPNPPSGPDRKSILLWVENFREMGSVSEKRWGRPRISRTPENIEAVRRSVLQSPRRSARKHHTKNGHHLQDILFKTMWFKTSHVVVSESKNKSFVSRIVFFLLFTLKFREVILSHPVDGNDKTQTDVNKLRNIIRRNKVGRLITRHSTIKYF